MKLIITLYAIIGLGTFGYSASGNASCREVFFRQECVVLSAALSAMLWPLFWSWEIADAGRAALAQGGGE